MLIDCDSCRAPADACADCVMTTLLQIDPRPVDLDDTERGALEQLAGAGLVPPLRLVVGVPSGFDADPPPPDDADAGWDGPDDTHTDQDEVPVFAAEDPTRPPRIRGIA